MRNNVNNLILFFFLATGFYFLWTYAEKNWLPQPPKDTRKEQAEQEAKKKAEADQKAREDQDRLDAKMREVMWDESRAFASVVGTLPFTAEATKPGFGAKLMEQQLQWTKKRPLASVAGNVAIAIEPKIPVKPPEPPKIVPPRERGSLIALGDDTFYNKVLLSTEGGGIQQVVLTRFEQADRLGRQMKGVPLYLIPGVPRVRGKYLEDNYPVPDLKPGKIGPETALAEPAYTIFHYPTPGDKMPDPKLGEMQWKVAAEEHPEGGEHKVVFEAELGNPYFVRFRKTYRLAPKDYHISLSIEIERLPGGEKGKGQLQYQLSGPREEPIEGEWYNNTYRVALVGWLDNKGRPGRQYETAANVAIKRGGEAVPRSDNTFKYMAIVTQYFASAVAIDDTAEGAAKNPWSYVRATTELPFGKTTDQGPPFFDDMTVRAASDTIDLAPGEKITHSYLIYNGPSKVMLLGLMEGDREVNENLVKRYKDKLDLKTLTDFHSPTWLGSFADAIYWTDLVIAFTNIMHWFMALIHTVIPSWALCIIVLTVMVRLLLHYPSKRQTRMNMRMMAVTKKLAPQFEELKKKYEGDFHGYNRAKMQLMMAHGVNPLAQMGGCLLLFAQMPIMMGLYYCLQESVFFRLEPFLWINNLAAPDMTVWWGEHIPYISAPDGLGGIIYLGPYLNILPIMAILLMFWQQLKMLPPPTDDQSRQQRTMMKMMMFVMPLFFYKFAAGLAMYFIIGSLWGLVERRLIKKGEDKGGEGGGALAELSPISGSPNGQETDAPPKPKGMFGRLREAMQKRIDDMKRHADEQSKRQIRNDKNAPDQGQGQGQAPGPNPNRRDDRRDKKKKRRK